MGERAISCEVQMETRCNRTGHYEAADAFVDLVARAIARECLKRSAEMPNRNPFGVVPIDVHTTCNKGKN